VGDHEHAGRKTGDRLQAQQQRGNVMNRFLLGFIGILVAVWLIFAVFNAMKGLIHLALVIAILLIAYNILMSLRNRTDEVD
jgi:uncharacterized membrane protein HdeD (DUF308 family)